MTLDSQTLKPSIPKPENPKPLSKDFGFTMYMSSLCQAPEKRPGSREAFSPVQAMGVGRQVNK